MEMDFDLEEIITEIQIQGNKGLYIFRTIIIKPIIKNIFYTSEELKLFTIKL